MTVMWVTTLRTTVAQLGGQELLRWVCLNLQLSPGSLVTTNTMDHAI